MAGPCSTVTPINCSDLTSCRTTLEISGVVPRYFEDRGADFVAVEDFGCVGDGLADDSLALKAAVDWSARSKRSVYAGRNYLLKTSGLEVTANTALVASPTARFIRGFGGQTNQDDGGFPLVFTLGDQPNIRIQGGLWNGIPDYDLVDRNAEPWIADITFTPGTPNLITFTGAKSKFFYPNGTWRSGIVRQLWVYKTLPNGDFDPSVANNNRLFTVTNFDGINRLTVAETPVNETVNGMTGSYVPWAGKVFSIASPGGVIDSIGIPFPRGIQFLLSGDDFLLTRSWSRNPPPDGGGGVRFISGRGMRGTLLDLETIDDCFQFTPAANMTVERSAYLDCVARTRQGALLLFANGGGRSYESPDPLSSLRDCLASNIRGVTGGSALHGGVAIKVYCANSSYPMMNCWAQDISVRQSDVTPPDTLRAGVMVVTGRAAEGGRPGSGVLNCGVRNLVVENRAGPLLAIGPADNLPANYVFSTAIDFTVEQAKGLGAGTWAGLPLIAAPFANRLVLRDISGDLSGGLGANPGRALEIGVNFNYVAGGLPATIVAGTVKELVIDGCATDNAALPSTGGIWRFGNIGKASLWRVVDDGRVGRGSRRHRTRPAERRPRPDLLPLRRGRFHQHIGR